MASQPIAEILFMEQLGEIGQRVQMLLELALRHHQIDRFNRRERSVKSRPTVFPTAVFSPLTPFAPVKRSVPNGA